MKHIIEHCEKEIQLLKKSSEWLHAVLPKPATPIVKAAHMAGQFDGQREAYEAILKMLTHVKKEEGA
jgi:hypothetical protein